MICPKCGKKMKLVRYCDGVYHYFCESCGARIEEKETETDGKK